MYCYDLKGKLVWQKDYGVQMRMRMAFGEGMAPVLAGDKLLLVFDHEGDSFMVALDKATGKEIWRVARAEKTNWAAPLVVDFKGRKQVIVSATHQGPQLRPRGRRADLGVRRARREYDPAPGPAGRPGVRDERLPEPEAHGDPARP